MAAGLLAMCLVLGLFADVAARAQTATTPHKSKTASRPAQAVWTPDVQQALGVSASDFSTSGLSRLTKPQLAALVSGARPDARRHLLTCPANGTLPSGVLHVLITVAGEDSTGEIASAIHQSIGSLAGVQVVSDAANADRALHVVIQQQTMGKRTIGFTAAYVTATPCSELFQGNTSSVELKQQLGTYTDPKGADLAHDLAGMMDQDLQPLRRGSTPAATPAAAQ